MEGLCNSHVMAQKELMVKCLCCTQGKYVEIQFTRGGEPEGGKISQFLLEKVRREGERERDRERERGTERERERERDRKDKDLD